MYLEWSNHSENVLERLSGLLSRNCLLDITLAAEGRFMRAHKVVLASVSKYFEVRKKDFKTKIRIYFYNILFRIYYKMETVLKILSFSSVISIFVIWRILSSSSTLDLSRFQGRIWSLSWNLQSLLVSLVSLVIMQIASLKNTLQTLQQPRRNCFQTHVIKETRF